MKATTAKMFVLALALGLMSAMAQATDYSITIPSVASYPATTIRFSAPGVLRGSQAIAANSIKVSFEGANFSASPTGGQWVTNASGTYFGFACDPSSVACMKATRGKGSYTYKLVGAAFAAPAKKGVFHLNWDVNPPGDVAEDFATLPEPSSLWLLVVGMLALVWLNRRKVTA
ncbi:MAG TPA: PEP-CTERM sorting domain-containing protein [Terriglobales bacterium]|nr:PEP-CTERM sorting domain-containing protein [Terriglobales bacterium]